MIKTRFAPSPTGYMHLGNARTALFCALLAKAQQGKFLLRIEDTDQSRSTEEFTEHLKSDLLWLGLPWQEGPDVGGEKGPYFQSQRHEIYHHYYQQLEHMELAYPCFCSEQELAIMRKVQLSSGQPPRYAGTCRHLTADQKAKKIEQGIQPTLRFRVPDNQTIKFTDFVKGEQVFQSNEIGDFIIRRADGTAAFFFCNAIDDALMGVTHAFRGEDHLTNTPRQIMMLQALNLPTPQYGHMAMILGSDGSPLSKRNGSRSIKELREEGYLVKAVQNYLARLGHYYSSNDFIDMDKLATEFSLSSVGTAPAHFDAAQLLYWQKQAAHHLDNDEFWQWLGGELTQAIPLNKKAIFIETVKANIVFPSDVKRWIQVFFAENFDYSDEAKLILQQTGKSFWQVAINAVDEHGAHFKTVSQTIQQQLNVKGKALFQPLRAALTGELDGPEMAKIFELLGVDEIKLRLHQASQITS